MTWMDIYRHPRASLRALQAWLLRRRIIPDLPRLDLPTLPVPRVRKSREEREALEEAANLAGSFYFREQILDDLDYYMHCIKRMKSADPQAYDLYTKLGAHLLPQSGEIILHGGLTPWWKENRPAFGAVAWTHGYLDEDNKKRGKITPRFWYFQKYRRGEFLRHRNVQKPPDGSDIYCVTTYWDQPREKDWKKPWPTEHLIAITPDNRVFPLKEYKLHPFTVTPKRKKWKPGQIRGGWKRGDSSGAPGRVSMMLPCWDVHEFFKDWAGEHKIPVEEFMTKLFFTAASMYEASNRGMIRVEAGKNGHNAVFSVDVKRTPYFFKDRGVTLNERGNKKRIFHIVRPHTRIDGVQVPMHFRGERQFAWNGFDVRITVPGLHHLPVPEFTPGAVMYDGLFKQPPGLTQKQVGEWLHGNIKGLDGEPNSMKNQQILPPVPKPRLTG